SPDRSSVSVNPGSIVVLGETASLTVTVRDDLGFPVPGATVTPSSSPATGAFAPATATTSASGIATFGFTATAPGEYVLLVQAGSVQLDGRAGVTVTKAATTTAIVSDGRDPSSLFEPTPVAVRVSSSVGGPLEGTVTVRENEGTGSCTAAVAAGGCELRFSGLGARSLTAAYAGDVIHEASVSAPEPHEVQLFAP
ncbi:MAG: Ig-like domain-containing protein, partial [Gammaproteobacteria bacterium]